MKLTIYSFALLFASGALLMSLGYRCSGTKKTVDAGPVEIIQTNVNGQGISIRLDFVKGESHNHPLMVVWTEDTSGRYIETLYVAESIGKGNFQHGDKSKGMWEAGAIQRPAALPYWGHKRGIQSANGLYIPTPENPVPDAVTGPTPTGNFQLQSRSTGQTPAVFKLLMEINQSWDWNEFWTNNKFPDDLNYKTSSQPSLVYEAVIDLNSPVKSFEMAPIGHGHYSGKDGSLTADLSTLTTALNIAEKIMVQVE